MTSPNPDSEDALEQATIALFNSLGWTTANLYNEWSGDKSSLGRETMSDVVLISRLRPALERLNPELPAEAIGLAVEELTRDRSALSRVYANREVYQLLKDGVLVNFKDSDENHRSERVQVIDWNTPDQNDFFLGSQFWVTGEMYKRRADLMGFVNGLPLLFVELKASHKNVENAFKQNFTDYHRAIPQIFRHNAFSILSNGHDARIGSFSSPWEHFSHWKKVDEEAEKGVIGLETIIRGTCSPKRLLDIVENFTLFTEMRGGLAKVVARNHQFLGVNNAIRAIANIKENRGRLGVFWHTQGSGKSYSMIFFSQKVLRKVPGNYTFVIVTDVSFRQA